ncbi:MAG: hypothetical protein ABIJ86_10785, partial [Spirochaetota bacterium]
MKRTLACSLPALIILSLSSCFLMGPDFGDWDGKLEGTEGLYNLAITQDGKDLVFTASLDTEKYAEVSTGEDFYPPEELFFWMAPAFKDDGDKGSSWNPYEMYPVARYEIKPEFFTGTSMVVRVNLESIANDWNRWWLESYRFDGDSMSSP